eukprot:1214505-Amorphochlora_amoeboformis.AAC.1
MQRDEVGTGATAWRDLPDRHVLQIARTSWRSSGIDMGNRVGRNVVDRVGASGVDWVGTSGVDRVVTSGVDWVGTSAVNWIVFNAGDRGEIVDGEHRCRPVL